MYDAMTANPSKIPTKKKMVRRKKNIIFGVFFFVLFSYLVITWRIISSIDSGEKNGNVANSLVGVSTEEEDIDSFRSNKWPKLQNALCGKGYPDPAQLHNLSTTFFNLARLEVFHDNEKSVRDDKLAKIFYDQDAWGTFLYYDANQRYDTNPTFQSVYMRAWKCGNNQIFAMTREMFAETERFNGTFQVLTLEGTNAALKKVGLLGKEKPPLITPCIYTAVRDPVSHFLSGYNEIEFRTLEKENPPFKVAPYHKDVSFIFSHKMRESNTSVSEDIFNSVEQQNRRKHRFKEFVKNLLQQKDAMIKSYEYYHAYSMTAVLNNLAKYNKTLTGYIPSVKNIHESWPHFIAEKCSGSPPFEEFPKMTYDGQHTSSIDPFQTYKAAKEVWTEKGNIASAICLIHTFDYSCWKDLPDGVPDFCMEVYQKYYNTIVSEVLIKQ